MEELTDIQKELTELSMLVAGIPKINIFTVPRGYFESIVPTLLTCLEEESGLPLQQTIIEASTVPAGYFDQLAGSILEKIQKEQAGSSETSLLLQQLRHQQMFTVPGGYFENLSAAVLQRIHEENPREEFRYLSPLLESLQGVNVFQLPAGYFDQLDNKLAADIIGGTGKEEETSLLSPLMLSLKTNNVFEVPDNYFDGVAATILKQLQPARGRVLSMRSSNMFKYAVAALFTGAMALGLYNYIGNSTNNTQPSNTMASLDAAIQKGRAMDEQQFDAALAQLTVTDITKYLEKNGDYSDMASIKITLDATTLPSEEDYLTNEGALEDYISEINQTQLNN